MSKVKPEYKLTRYNSRQLLAWLEIATLEWCESDEQYRKSHGATINSNLYRNKKVAQEWVYQLCRALVDRGLRTEAYRARRQTIDDFNS